MCKYYYENIVWAQSALVICTPDQQLGGRGFKYPCRNRKIKFKVLLQQLCLKNRTEPEKDHLYCTTVGFIFCVMLKTESRKWLSKQTVKREMLRCLEHTHKSNARNDDRIHISCYMLLKISSISTREPTRPRCCPEQWESHPNVHIMLSVHITIELGHTFFLFIPGLTVAFCSAVRVLYFWTFIIFRYRTI